MKTISHLLMAVLLCLPISLMAESITIVDNYAFPTKASSLNTASVSGALGDVTIAYSQTSGHFDLRSSCLRIRHNDATITITMPTGKSFANGDKITIVGTYKTSSTTGLGFAAGENTYDAIAANPSDGVTFTTEVVIGTENGQLNAAGAASVVLKRYGTESIEVTTLTITGNERGEEDPEGPTEVTWATVFASTTWDWTKAYADNDHKTITLTETSIPTKTDEFVLANVEGISKNYSEFNSAAIKMIGENPVRNGNACQASTLKLNLGERGKLVVTFCNVGAAYKVDGTTVDKGLRGIKHNGVAYETTSSSTENEIEATFYVQAGEHTLTGYSTDKGGNQAIRIKKIVYEAAGSAIEQITISESTVWDWTKAAFDPTLEKIQPSSTTTMYVMANFPGVTTNYEQFESRAIKLMGENVLRNGDACQIAKLSIITTVNGTLKVTFCNVGDSGKGTRYLCINGVVTDYSVETTTTITVAELPVAAGELVLTGIRKDAEGNQAIRIKKIEFIKAESDVLGTYERTVTEGNYGTVCLPYAVAAGHIAGATILEVESLTENGDGIILAEVDHMEAGRPYIFQATADLLSLEYGYQYAATAELYHGLQGFYADDEMVVPIGAYVLAQKKLWEVDGVVYIDRNRAYLIRSEIPAYTSAASSAPRRVLLMPEGSTVTTGVENASAVRPVEGIYDIMGRRLSEPQSGLNIINGEKVLIP